MGARLDHDGVTERSRADLLGVERDLGSGLDGDFDLTNLGDRLPKTVDGVRALLLRDVFCFDEKLPEVAGRIDGMAALETAQRDVYEDERMLLQCVGLQKRHPRLLELSGVVKGHTLFEPGPSQRRRGRVGWIGLRPSGRREGGHDGKNRRQGHHGAALDEVQVHYPRRGTRCASQQGRHGDASCVTADERGENRKVRKIRKP